MFKKIISVAVMAGLAFGATSALAQKTRNPNQKTQLIIYKWYDGGRVQYTKIPPRGKSYVMLNKYGMVITQDTPFSDGVNSNIVKAVKVEDSDLNPAATPVPGTITKEQRCEAAKKNLQIMNTRPTVYEEDASGNLIPLSKEDVASRKADAQEQINVLCNN